MTQPRVIVVRATAINGLRMLARATPRERWESGEIRCFSCIDKLDLIGNLTLYRLKNGSPGVKLDFSRKIRNCNYFN